MPDTDPPLEAVEEIRQLNRLFLDFVRQLPSSDGPRFGLSASVFAALRNASGDQIARAAAFPRALFSLGPDFSRSGTAAAAAAGAAGSGEQVLRLVLLYGARNLCRMSGYWGRLLLRLGDDAVGRLRVAGVDEIVEIAASDHVVRAAFDEIDWIWEELLTESRPEYRRRLLLIGFQPDASPPRAFGMA